MLLSKIFFNLCDDFEAAGKFISPPDIQLFMLWTKDQDLFIQKFFDEEHQGNE